MYANMIVEVFLWKLTLLLCIVFIHEKLDTFLMLQLQARLAYSITAATLFCFVTAACLMPTADWLSVSKLEENHWKLRNTEALKSSYLFSVNLILTYDDNRRFTSEEYIPITTLSIIYRYIYCGTLVTTCIHGGGNFIIVFSCGDTLRVNNIFLCLI